MKQILHILLIGLLCFLQFKLWFRQDGISETWTLHHTLAHQLKENKALNDRNSALLAEVKDLKHGQDAIEERARTDLGMIKKGEVFYQFIDG